MEDKPYYEAWPEEQDWDFSFFALYDHYGHTGALFLTLGYIEESDFRWIEYDLA